MMAGPIDTQVADFFVAGTPRPQGSARPITSKGGRVFMKYGEPMAEWRNQLVEAFGRGGIEMIGPEVPVRVTVMFGFRRPHSHSRVRALRDRGYRTNGADIDKLARLVLDALGIARIYDDDRQVADLIARKRYVEADEPEGVRVVVETLG